MATKLIRRDPFDVFSPFFEFTRRWNDGLRGLYDDEQSRMIVPAMDVAEAEDAITISAELPGLKKEDVTLTFEKGVLTLSGEKKFEKEEKKSDYHCVERRYGAFHRSITLPSHVDANKAEAAFADGVLTIRIPKMEQAKPKQLPIK